MNCGIVEVHHGYEMKKLKNKKILITGITGLIGSWLAEELLNDNEVYGISLDKTKNELLQSKNLIDDLNIEYFDISISEKVSDYFYNKKFDIVFHLAAQTQVHFANKFPIETFDSNIRGTWNILNQCWLSKTPVVVASSDKAYGISKELPYTEETPLKGVFPYEVSKTVTDLLTTSFIETYGLHAVTLRCGNVYGGGDLNWDRLIPGVAKWLIQDKTPILRTDGSFKRDWIYVEDVANAYSKLGFELYNNPLKVSTSYNFAGQDYLSVAEVYKILCLEIKQEYVNPIFEIQSRTEIEDQYLDSTKIEKELGIRANFSIKEGIAKTHNWYREYLANI